MHLRYLLLPLAACAALPAAAAQTSASGARAVTAVRLTSDGEAERVERIRLQLTPSAAIRPSESSSEETSEAARLARVAELLRELEALGAAAHGLGQSSAEGQPATAVAPIPLEVVVQRQLAEELANAAQAAERAREGHLRLEIEARRAADAYREAASEGAAAHRARAEALRALHEAEWRIQDLSGAPRSIFGLTPPRPSVPAAPAPTAPTHWPAGQPGDVERTFFPRQAQRGLGTALEAHEGVRIEFESEDGAPRQVWRSRRVLPSRGAADGRVLLFHGIEGQDPIATEGDTSEQAPKTGAQPRVRLRLDAPEVSRPVLSPSAAPAVPAVPAMPAVPALAPRPPAAAEAGPDPEDLERAVLDELRQLSRELERLRGDLSELRARVDQR